MKSRFVSMSLAVAMAVLIVACSEDDAIDPAATGPTDNVINRETLLGNVEDVRALISDSASGLDPMLVNDVDYSEGNLRVVLAESQNNIDVSELESMCDEVSQAIALPDLSVTVEKADASESAECEFRA